jgi:hypothetical protein
MWKFGNADRARCLLEYLYNLREKCVGQKIYLIFFLKQLLQLFYNKYLASFIQDALRKECKYFYKVTNIFIRFKLKLNRRQILLEPPLSNFMKIH